MIVKHLNVGRAAPERRGNATFVSLVAVTVLGGMSAGILALTTASHSETQASIAEVRAEFAATAGVADALRELTFVSTDKVDDPAGQGQTQSGAVAQTWNDSWSKLFTGFSGPKQGNHKPDNRRRKQVGAFDVQACNTGTKEAPHSLEGSNFWSTIADDGDGQYTITSTGTSGAAERRIEVVVNQTGSLVFENALFAGNSSGDMNYALELGGVGSQADEIQGDVYSGGGIDVVDDATVTGSMRATGVITGGSGGSEGIVQEIPDLAGMGYDTMADFDVAAMFSSGLETYASDAAGGSAWQLPETSPGHIFRKNPSDRTGDTAGTTKDDYFLEDPHETVRSDSSSDGSNPYLVSVSGQGDEPGPDGDNKVYYIDGNLWLHNKKTMSMGIASPDADGTRITFVVRGNIYFSDNLFYGQPDLDGVCFIALEDANEPDSGNIYFGDPSFGTLEQMHAFMYAENNFYDNNLDESGSADVKVFGNMSAGNHVLIERDYGDQHSKLTVALDDRIRLGELQLPGLPTQAAGGAMFQILSWRELPVD